VKTLFLTPAVLFVFTEFIKTAIQAQSVMTAYHPSALVAVPLCLFLIQETHHAIISNKLEVFQHTHMVFAAVTLIEGFQPGARKISALITKSYNAIPQ
jgi:hypothetical protein